MPDQLSDQLKSRISVDTRVLIRLDTLIRLRWYAIIGQAGAILIIAFGFQYQMPWPICLILIALSAALNLWLAQRYRINHRLSDNGVFALLAFDIVQLGMLLFLTGGLENPFAILLLAPVVVSSTSLRRDHILMLGGLVVIVISLLVFQHYPLPWEAGTRFQIPFLYSVGVWVAIVCTLAFTAIYAFRVAVEARKLADALSATELVLQREQHLSALDGLAAAAAHELGTPLATIALVSKEMMNLLPADSPMREDAALLRSQSERCREILQKLSSLSSAGDSIVETETLLVLVEEEVAPLRDFGVDIAVHVQGDPADMPRFSRNPGVHYSLGNLIDNAVDFAKSTVSIIISYDATMINIEISDDGPGFPPSLLHRLGEPFLTQSKTDKKENQKGMGLGLFIAKTLLERSGADLAFKTKVQPPHLSGAFVSVSWNRERLENTESRPS